MDSFNPSKLRSVHCASLIKSRSLSRRFHCAATDLQRGDKLSVICRNIMQYIRVPCRRVPRPHADTFRLNGEAVFDAKLRLEGL